MSKKISLDEYKECIDETFADWSDFLGVQHQWSIEILYKKAKEMDEVDSIAECFWPWYYRSATIRFNVDYIVKKQPTMRDIRETVVHELGHLVSSGLWDTINQNFQGNIRKILLDSCETEVDTWTRLIMRAREEVPLVEEEDDAERSL